ncbi:MAG: serine/threonine-protein kinase [Kofleriaceae bacterium]
MVEGSELGGYRIVRQIGAGGMGTVWLAEHVKLGRKAALKVLHPSFSHQPDVVTRFFNEARAATAIPDPGIVQVFDFGHSADGIPYIVMELLEGEALDRRLHRLGGLPIADSLRILRQVASTLGLAHQRGIVHRDIKPENIFLVRDPEVAGGERAKLLDFGIAKLLGEQTNNQTQTKTVIGTPLYMSPEQCRGTGNVDQRSDVYSMGCVLFRLVTGTPPYMGEGTGDLIAMHLREPPVPPSRRKPGIPAEIDQIVLRCLAKDPAQRFASGAQLAAALGLLVGSTSMPQFANIAESPTMIAKASSPTTIGMATGASTPSERLSLRAKPVLVLGGVVAAAAIVTIILAITGGSDVPATASQTTVPASQPAAPAPQSPPPLAVVPQGQPAPPADPAAVAVDPQVALEARMKRLFAKFTLWARDHAGAPCPELSAIDANATDPWGRPLVLTCTQQPETQVVGAISLGPDGVASTADDIASWKLKTDISIPGRRWAAPPVAATATTVPARPTKPSRSRTRSEKSPATAGETSPAHTSSPSGTDLDNDGIPDVR